MQLFYGSKIKNLNIYQKKSYNKLQGKCIRGYLKLAILDATNFYL